MGVPIRYDFGLKAIIETTRGTYLEPTDPLCLLEGAKRPTPEYKTKDIKKMTGYDASGYVIVQDPSNPSAKAEITHWMPLSMKDATTGAVPAIFRSCGMSVGAITTPSAGFKYSHVTGQGDTASVLAVGIRESTKFKSGQGSFDITFNLDEAIEFSASMTLTQDGLTTELASGDADNTIPTLALIGDSDVLYYSSVNPATVNGNPACLSDVKFMQNNNIVTKECTDGKIQTINSKDPKISFSQRLTKEFEASFNDISSGTEFNIVIPISDRSGNAVGQFVFPKCVVETNDPNDGDGMLELSRTLSCRETVGDDNYYFELYT